MATQADADAVATGLADVKTKLAQVSTDVAASSAKLQTEIDNLSHAVPAGVDLSAVQSAAADLAAAVAPLDAAAKAIGDLAPTPLGPPAP